MMYSSFIQKKEELIFLFLGLVEGDSGYDFGCVHSRHRDYCSEQLLFSLLRWRAHEYSIEVLD